jgi:hypothetical protein
MNVKNAIFLDVTTGGSVRTDVSVEGIASIIRVTGIGVLGTTLAVTSNRSKLRDGGDMFLLNFGYYKSHTARSQKT